MEGAYQAQLPYSQWGIQNNTERGHSYGAAAYPAQAAAPPANAGQLTVLPTSLSPSGQTALASTTASVLPSSAASSMVGVPPSSPPSPLPSTAVPPAVSTDQGSQYLMAGGSGSATPNLGILSPASVFGV